MASLAYLRTPPQLAGPLQVQPLLCPVLSLWLVNYLEVHVKSCTGAMSQLLQSVIPELEPSAAGRAGLQIDTDNPLNLP